MRIKWEIEVRRFEVAWPLAIQDIADRKKTVPYEQKPSLWKKDTAFEA